MFPKTQPTPLIPATPIPLRALMHSRMPSQPCGRNKRFITPCLGAGILLLVCVGALDVLGEVFLFEVGFVTGVVGAFVRAVVGVRAEVGG